jgi:hypothetical protein
LLQSPTFAKSLKSYHTETALTVTYSIIALFPQAAAILDAWREAQDLRRAGVPDGTSKRRKLQRDKARRKKSKTHLTP